MIKYRIKTVEYSPGRIIYEVWCKEKAWLFFYKWRYICMASTLEEAEECIKEIAQYPIVQEIREYNKYGKEDISYW